MASRITKLTAAAAVFLVAAIIGIYQLGGSIDSASIAWGDVVAPILTARTATYPSGVLESMTVHSVFSIIGLSSRNGGEYLFGHDARACLE